MAIRFYDEAIIDKIKGWVKDPNMTILKPDEMTRLLQQRADQTLDQPISLPLIGLSRDPDIEIQSTNKKPLTFDGLMIRADEEKSIQLDAIPIEINYQLDIYTRYGYEGDEYMRNFVFGFVNNPKMIVEIPYNNQNLTHTFNVRLLSRVSDNSDIKERLFADQFTRWTLFLQVDDAYLFSVPIKDNVSIVEVEIETLD